MDVLPPSRFGHYDNYASLASNPANHLLFRVHADSGRGSLVPNIGFVASDCPTPVDDPTRGVYTGSLGALCDAATVHVTQWKYKTWNLPSMFLSATFSIAHALREARRWNVYHRTDTTQISVIYAPAIGTNKWLATELVGASGTPATWFARSALEVLIYQRIPFGSIIVTAPLASFLACLPGWCDEVKRGILSGDLKATEHIVNVLAFEAGLPANNTPAEEHLLVMQSVERCIGMLRDKLPASMADYDYNTHEDVVDAIVLLATFFVWWPKWIIRVEPAAYPAHLKRVRNAVIRRLRHSKMDARRDRRGA
ncbi:hypothetical protein B0H11DRAFT_1961410 [Mycena galericulata]|nr:hypothetical protein B0H11DRAFT_1961410 [Mycena galericulata]